MGERERMHQEWILYTKKQKKKKKSSLQLIFCVLSKLSLFCGKTEFGNSVRTILPHSTVLTDDLQAEGLAPLGLRVDLALVGAGVPDRRRPQHQRPLRVAQGGRRGGRGRGGRGGGGGGGRGGRRGGRGRGRGGRGGGGGGGEVAAPLDGEPPVADVDEAAHGQDVHVRLADPGDLSTRKKKNSINKRKSSHPTNVAGVDLVTGCPKASFPPPPLF